jgi:hypothetical protein
MEGEGRIGPVSQAMTLPTVRIIVNITLFTDEPLEE